MSDKTHEAISALVDNEASELEIHRGINQLKESAELRERWRRYHLVGAVLNDSHMSNDIKDIDLVGSIAAQIASEDSAIQASNMADNENQLTAVNNPQSLPKTWVSYFAGTAVAASVALSVILGFGVFESEPLSSQGLVNNGIQQEGEFKSLQPVSTQSIASTIGKVDQQTLGEDQRKLQQYLLDHANNPAFNSNQRLTPFAQVVSFEQSQPLKNRTP